MAEQLINGVVHATEIRETTTDRLEHELRFARLIASLSSRFISVLPEHVDAHIVDAMKEVCEELGLERTGMAQLTPDADLIVTHSWAASGLAIISDISAKNLPWVAEHLRRNQEVHFTDLGELPPEAAQDKATFERIQTRSFAGFPLFAGGKLWGGIGFDTARFERDWPEEMLERLRPFRDLLAAALERKWTDKSLQEAYLQIKELNEQLERENVYLRDEIRLQYDHASIIGHADPIRLVLRNAEQVAGTDSTVLLLGETGTGKELIARTIHDHSKRANRPMVKVNCAAIPTSLVESELFGREKGAYTGALTREVGRFELADNSTIFLDEVGELPLELQAKLLRVLQEGEFERLGSSRTLRVNVRVIAATSRNLTAAVKEGKFRPDLFYRINVFPITLPPLRERREDIPALVWHFIRELGSRMGRNVETVRTSTMKAFQSYSWPGNVRELRNLVERSLILSPGPELHAELPTSGEVELCPGTTLKEVECAHIRRILERSQWRIRGADGAAAILGLKPTTLESRLKKLGISRSS
jgi:transcriptional regulator with GAF, ATPase, and Fis domain